MIRRVLVANRGEIARRVFATCRQMGITTVAVYSDADAGSPHAREADYAVRLPGNAPGETYLRGDLIVDAARRSGADAIHPGYGFLAENAEFAAAVLDAGFTWVGPPPKAIAAMGSKLEAKALLAEAGVPILASWTEPNDVSEFPVLVKASAGGGGRGMRIVRAKRELAESMAAAGREAAAAFGDATVFCERYIANGRHIEVQIFGDTHGTVVALGERECSIQRRHQKILEESPSPAVGDELRTALGEAAVSAARAVGYVGAGTVEFLLEPDGHIAGGDQRDKSAGGDQRDKSAGGHQRHNFYFLEMNTRLQVEHPVTECVLGLDLVRLQLLVAEGRPLPFTQTPPMRGHAIEVRLYAEDPVNGWRPATGTLHRFAVSGEENAFAPLGHAGTRVDSGVADGSMVSVHYDPMLAKVIAWAWTREEAARALESALTRATIHGVVTNRDLLVRVLRAPEFGQGGTDTAFLDRHPEVFAPLLDARRDQGLACLAAAVTGAAARRKAAAWGGLPAGWRNVASMPQIAVFDAPWGRTEVRYQFDRDGRLAQWSAHGDDEFTVDVAMASLSPDEVVFDDAGVRRTFRVRAEDGVSYVDSLDGPVALVEIPRFPLPVAEIPAGSLVAQMPGAVGRLAVMVGQEVAAGDLLLTLEAMKLEHAIHAPASGTVTDLYVEPGCQVEAGDVLAVVSAQDANGREPVE